jgi:FkbM family methyltransferase
MVAFLKRIVRRVLRAQGYDVIKVSDKAPERQIVNAFYRGRCFRCFKGDPQCDFILSGRGWDNQLEPLLAELVGQGRTNVVEIGANIGGSTVSRATDFPSLTFHCVEPVPEFFALLSENARSYGGDNVRLYDSAISSRDGQRIQIFTQVGTAGAVESYDGHTAVGTVDVTSVSVDTLFADVDIALLKIDTDGFEYDVLVGSKKTVQASRPLIFIEYHPELIRRSGKSPGDLCTLLGQYGYEVAAIWSNEGVRIDARADLQQLPHIAERAAPYVDVLLRPK